ncbi:MAG: hypothetical protein Q8R04_02270 [Nanoarchaeota archaeon]|nr:hypothetical protein [Nanoarchaeota archaeon]
MANTKPGEGLISVLKPNRVNIALVAASLLTLSAFSELSQMADRFQRKCSLRIVHNHRQLITNPAYSPETNQPNILYVNPMCKYVVTPYSLKRAFEDLSDFENLGY